jgi:AbrB family looped-hinge helix DNA binding protein
MRITTKGQVTIPIEIREALGLLPYTEVEFELMDGWAKLKKKEDGQRARGRRIVAGMRGRADAGLSTEEILALTRGEGE